MRAYLALVAGQCARGELDSRLLVTARARMGRAINEADGTFEQSIGQPGTAFARIEAAQTLLTYARRFVGATTELAIGRTPETSRPIAQSVMRMEEVCSALALALEAPERPVPPMPDVAAMIEGLVGYERATIERMTEALRVMVTAVHRTREDVSAGIRARGPSPS